MSKALRILSILATSAIAYVLIATVIPHNRSAVKASLGTICFGVCPSSVPATCADGGSGGGGGTMTIEPAEATQAGGHVGGSTNCQIVVTGLEASLAGDETSFQGTNIQLWDWTGGNCGSGSFSPTGILLWEQDISINAYHPVDHVISDAGNIALLGKGDSLCVMFAGALGSAFEKINVQYNYE